VNDLKGDANKNEDELNEQINHLRVSISKLEEEKADLDKAKSDQISQLVNECLK
jgi:hypothetical protein